MTRVEPVPFNLTEELLGAPDIPLTTEEQEALEKRKQLIDQLRSEDSLAKYKLEVMFSHRHTARAPTPGIVTWWESGNKLHGGGDSKLYLCDASVPELEGKGCKCLIPDSANGLTFLVCPHCKTMWRADQVVGEIWYNLPLQKWSEVLYQWYLKLEMNADIYVKYAKKRLISATEKEQEKQMGGELLGQVRSSEQRMRYSYPLRNIIKDTAAGADLLTRIRAFLEA